MINYCIDEQKRRMKIVNIEEHQPPNNKNSNEERNFTLEDDIDKLAPKYKEVIILKYIQDMSIIDISKVMSCPEGTVKTWHSRALKQLRDLLNKAGDFNV
ncbi:MAG: RNA polymerase sigma factor [Clostridiaceae bacterium]|nr:RNA polymerase sigma factor [Clostridiaceae bacterium]